jgi:DNA-binding response OmpR family regulator
VPKAEFYENAWGLPYSDNTNALFTAVSRLNKKLDDNKADVTITYERGKGYALESI